jgi:hypothetical protein
MNGSYPPIPNRIGTITISGTSPSAWPSSTRFLEYEAQIRQEYGWVPRIIFAPKRAKILETFLARERIYTTDWFHRRYDRRGESCSVDPQIETVVIMPQ